MKKCENPLCDNVVTEIAIKTKKLKIYCSAGCRGKHNAIKSREKAKQTMLERHGVEHALMSGIFKEKSKQTMLDRHGVEHSMQSATVKEKSKQTMLERHGVENPMHSPEIKERVRQTNLTLHGVENPSQSEKIKEKKKYTNLSRRGTEYAFQCIHVKEKIKQTNLLKYGVENPSQSVEIKTIINNNNMFLYGSTNYSNRHISQETQKLINDSIWLKEQNETKTLEQISAELSINSLILSRRFKKFNIPVKHHAKSYFEKQICEYVQTLHTNVLQNDRIQIKPFELDVYLPDLNIAFECNGEWCHQDLNKEISKYEKCEKLGIKLYFIWYSDWIERKDEVLRLISNILLQK